MYMKVVIKLQSWSNLPGDGLRRHKQEHSASYCKRTRENILSGMSIGFEGDVSHIWMMGPNIIRTMSAWWYCNLIARCSWTIRTVVFVTARALFLFGRGYVGLCCRLDFIIPNKPLTQFWYEIGVLVFFHQLVFLFIVYLEHWNPMSGSPSSQSGSNTPSNHNALLVFIIKVGDIIECALSIILPPSLFGFYRYIGFVIQLNIHYIQIRNI